MNKETSIRELKATARAQLIGRYGTAIPAILLITAIQLIIMFMTDSGNTGGSAASYLLRYVISLIVDLLTGILIYGRACFFLKVAGCSNELSVKDIFAGFKANMDKAIMIQIPFTVVAVLCTAPIVLMNLGMMQPLFGGYSLTIIIMNLIQIVAILVARLYLGLAFYVLADRPDIEAIDALKESLRLMEGRKLRLVIIALSMIPLLIGAVLALMVGVLWYEAYLRTLLADFYLEAKGEALLIPGREPQNDRQDWYRQDHTE